MSSQTFDLNLYRFDRSVCSAQALLHPLTCPVSTKSAICLQFVMSKLEFWSVRMEFFSTSWWSTLLAIVLIDLLLAGDNAIVIALAARGLPAPLQKKAIVWGTVGAIVVRAAMTVGVVWLLKVPGLMLAGGLGLLWIAYRLLVDQDRQVHKGSTVSTFWGAMKTIVVADALMGIDNVLGIAGASQGAFELVIMGLLISIPIVVLGSTLVLKLVERFPVIIKLGAAVLAVTAAKMIVSEPLLSAIYDASSMPASAALHGAAQWVTYALAITGVLGAGWWATQRSRSGPGHELAAD
jgi:YjbE family integral membrane protein